MGSTTGIAWTDHTFNPWRGCTRVSAGCANCYAEKMSKRNPGVLGEWGPNGKRPLAATSYWRLPVQWDAAAKRDGVRRRVFCASLADVFEARPELDAQRRSLFAVIAATPNLDWLLLTKRPENITRLMPEAGLPNVWLGVSAEDQDTLRRRAWELLKVPAAVRFLSLEPLLGRVDLDELELLCKTWRRGATIGTYLDWVIVGGESGPKARPFDVSWARSVVKQCREAGVPCFVKQLGARPYDLGGDELHADGSVPVGCFEGLRDRAGADPAEWPEDLRVREFPR